jgi:2-succinyl-5-enolpyruvyl-6-hydroxy-3-cyclohexene-1-carboxylate synthase
VRCGDLPTSKALRAWLAALGDDAVQVALDAESAWQDPAGAAQLVLAAHPAATLAAAEGEIARAGDEWLERWRAADAGAASRIAEVLRGELSEPQVTRVLAERLPADATLFVASSMPVRDVERFTPVRDDPPRTLSNRGANGIDGTVSSAFGAAAVSDGPVVALVGDVALAYDIGGLLCHTRLGLSLTIVLLNNDGGGIFEFLPIAGEQDAFEEHVATPHGLDFAHAAAFYGCEHVLAESLDAFRELLDGAIGSAGTTLIEVRTDRAENLALHQRI